MKNNKELRPNVTLTITEKGYKEESHLKDELNQSAKTLLYLIGVNDLKDNDIKEIQIISGREEIALLSVKPEHEDVKNIFYCIDKGYKIKHIEITRGNGEKLTFESEDVNFIFKWTIPYLFNIFEKITHIKATKAFTLDEE